MKPNLENLKEYTHKTSLSQEEKFAMLQDIRNYTNANPIKTPYHSLFFKHPLAYASMFALIIGTTATSFAAESSLPGDILYPVKTEINEKVVKTLSITKNQKAKTNVHLVDKRMEELTEMVVTEKDTPEKIDTIIAQLEEHKKDIEEYLEEVEVSDIEASEDAIEIYTELESVVDAHLEILENIAENTQSTITLTDIIDSIEATSTIDIEKDKNDESTQTSTTTPITGEQDAVLEILDFSAELEPILVEAKSKNQTIENEATSTQIRADVRKRIIEKVEEELQIDIEELNQEEAEIN